MWRLSRSMAPFVLSVVVIASSPSVVAATNLCLRASDGVDIVLKNFVLRRGKTFAVAGWTVTHAGGTPLYRPVSGQALARSDGMGMTLGLTEYAAGVYPGTPASYGLGGGVTTYSIVVFDPLGHTPGLRPSGSFLRITLTTTVGNIDVTPTDSSLTVSDCSRLGDLALP